MTKIFFITALDLALWQRQRLYSSRQFKALANKYHILFLVRVAKTQSESEWLYDTCIRIINIFSFSPCLKHDLLQKKNALYSRGLGNILTSVSYKMKWLHNCYVEFWRIKGSPILCSASSQDRCLVLWKDGWRVTQQSFSCLQIDVHAPNTLSATLWRIEDPEKKTRKKKSHSAELRGLCARAIQISLLLLSHKVLNISARTSNECKETGEPIRGHIFWQENMLVLGGKLSVVAKTSAGKPGQPEDVTLFSSQFSCRDTRSPYYALSTTCDRSFPSCGRNYS